MTTSKQYFSWFPFLFACAIALIISCSDNAGPDRNTMEISRISPDSGAVGTRVSIYSNSIAPEHAKNQVEINGMPVPILSFASDKLVVEVPEGMSSGPVTLQVNGKVANGPYFKLLTDGPEIDGVTPGRGGPGTQVTITGDHFLPTSVLAKAAGDSAVRDTISATNDSLRSEVPEVTLKAKGEPTPNINGLPVSVAFGDQLAPLLSLSNTEIIVEIPEEATSGTITLIVGEQTAVSSSFTLLRPPVISKVSPTAGPVGSEVIISGHYFVPQADSNQVMFNGTRAQITEADSTRLVVTIPPETTTGFLTVTTRGQATEGPTFTVTEAPVPQVEITNLSPKQGPIGTEVTIEGVNFSSSKAANTVTFNGKEATITSASKTKLVVTVPKDATDGPVKVQVGNQNASGPSFNVTQAPVPQVSISDISPKSGPVGTSVTITGQNFGAMGDENTVTFNGTKATVSSASKTKLVVTVPNSATSGPVQVTVDGQTTTGPNFNVTENPVPQVEITDISPKRGPIGTDVTIIGTNFSATASDNTVTFNGTKATVSSASTTKLTTSLPAGATSGPVKVQVGDQTATGPTFTVTENHAPTITSDASFAVDENSTAVGTIVATDPEGDALTYSISGGDDTDAFTINANSGELALNTVPDVENPSDGNGDNVYEVQIAASDGSKDATQDLTVSVTNVNEAPAITSNSSFGVDENTTAIGTVSATDPEGDALTYSISSGEDQTLFNIDSNSGELIFTAPPDFEHPADANHDNTYQAQVQATDGQETATQSLTVTLQDVVGDPSYNAGQIFVDERPYYPIFMVDGTFSFVYDDPIPDGTDLSPANDPMFDFSLTFNTPDMAASGRSVILSGPDQDSFTITKVNYGSLTVLQLEFTGGNNGVVEYDNPQDADSDHRYEFVITVDDGTNNPPSRQTFILPVGPN